MKIRKALVFEDDVFKWNDVRSALQSCGVVDVERVRDQDAGFEILQKDASIGLIVTDMQYPLRAGGAVDDDAGFLLMERLRRAHRDIPVIVCSAKNYDIPQAAGTVWYNERGDLAANFREILDRITEK